MALKIKSLSKNSTLYKYGLRKEDKILSINEKKVEDIIDLMYFRGECVVLEYERESSRNRIVIDEFDYSEVEFEDIKPIRCRLRCIFCFMDQMPKGLRPSLYLKDDDYRLSFLYGNYITLTNLSNEQLLRIKEYNLYPLYVSVHSTIPSIRSFMMGSEKAGDIVFQLKRLQRYCKMIHTQIVLCPGVNDGYSLTKTIMDLAEMYPFVQSVAVVPVGLTRYRKNLFPLRPVTKRIAVEILNTILSFGDLFKRELGTRFVFPADEFFVKAGVRLPEVDFYEDFYQMDDGIGMISYFIHNLLNSSIRKRALRVTVVTGEIFYEYLDRALRDAGFYDYQVLPVKNRFFGKNVNVTGLLTGGDIVREVREKALYEEVWIPDILFNDDGLTIDDMDVDDLGILTGKRIKVIPHLVEHFLDYLS